VGSLFYSFQEAANRLGCSKRTIHNYIKQGYLRKSNQSGKVVLLKEDVEQLAAETGVDLPAFNRKNFFLLLRRVEKLEQDMMVARRMLDIQSDPLRPNAEYAAILMKEVELSLLKSDWVDEEMRQWVEVFERLDEVALESLRNHLGLLNPYVPFFKLCMAFLKRLSTRDGFSQSLQYQLLHKQIDAARVRMRTCILMWSKVSSPTSAEEVIKGMESEKEKLFKRVKANT